MNEQINRARAGLVLDSPFFASLLLRLQCIEDASCQTAYTDGKVIGFSPNFISKLSLAQTKGFLAHEVMHIALEHHLRRQERDPQNWNIAADYAINDILLSCGFELPQGGLTGMGTDKSAEYIYARLPQQHGQGQGQGQSQGKGQGQQQQGKGQSQGNGQQQDPGGCGEVRDAKNANGQAVSPAERERLSAEVKVMVQQAAQAARAAGRMPAELDRLVKEIVEPKVSWSEVLRRFIQASAKNDYRMMPPNRRYIHRGLYLPSLRSDELPEVVVAIDTSGSIGQREIDQFAAEVSAVLQDFDTTVSVLYCDTDIHSVEEFKREDLPLTLKPIGGGGTDFRPPFEWVEREGRTPACLIYLTDLYCNSLPDEPSYPVLWANIGQERTMPFGEVINVK